MTISITISSKVFRYKLRKNELQESSQYRSNRAQQTDYRWSYESLHHPNTRSNRQMDKRTFGIIE